MGCVESKAEESSLTRLKARSVTLLPRNKDRAALRTSHPIEINPHYFIGWDRIAAFGTHCVQTQAHGVQVDLSSRSRSQESVPARAEYKANVGRRLLSPYTPLMDKAIENAAWNPERTVPPDSTPAILLLRQIDDTGVVLEMSGDECPANAE